MARWQSFQASKLAKIYYCQFAIPNELVRVVAAYTWLLDTVKKGLTRSYLVLQRKT